MIDWSTVFVTSVIAIGIAMFFRYVIKQDINKIYEENRADLIKGMLDDVYGVQDIMGDVFSILENKSGFNPKQDGSIQFTPHERTQLRWHYRQIHTFYEGFRRFNQWRTHMTKKEFFALANYVSMSDGFVESLLNDLTYTRSFLEERQKNAHKIIELLGNHITAEFRNAWPNTN